MHRLTVLLVSLLSLAACGPAVLPNRPPTTPPALPEEVLVTNDAGDLLATQPGPLWVMLSGVDEHGLIAEHEVTLLAAPDAEAAIQNLVHTGTAVIVQEIRQTGPQNLRRFYLIHTVEGKTGWISDYYVRRIVYLYNSEGRDVPVYAAPGERETARLTNVYPVTIKEASQPDWWIVQTPEDKLLGWVAVEFVKESPEPEFLTNQQHEHTP